MQITKVWMRFQMKDSLSGVPFEKDGMTVSIQESLTEIVPYEAERRRMKRKSEVLIVSKHIFAPDRKSWGKLKTPKFLKDILPTKAPSAIQKLDIFKHRGFFSTLYSQP